ncbi:hypothetical protein MMC28_007596 [Mycoblastus sanguinarius]|nr:hypothetical protein [Mycoblastus sanguinarius]
MADTTRASTSIAVEPNLEASHYGEEPDSAYGDEVGSYTTSLASNVTNYRVENNRRYHAYKDGSYVYPNDEKESDRLDIMHKLTEVILGGKLNLAPVPRNPDRILDIGTGTGIWAMEMGKTFDYMDCILVNRRDRLIVNCLQVTNIQTLQYVTGKN